MTVTELSHLTALDDALARAAWLEPALVRRFGADAGARLFERLSNRMVELAELPTPFVDERETAFVQATVLPVVALYHALRLDGLTDENAQTEIRRVYAQRLRERPVLTLNVMRHFPLYRQWLRRRIRREVAAAFPPPVFSIQTVEDSADALAVDIKRCPYADALEAYGAPELKPNFCRFDEVRFDTLAGVASCTHLQESGTCRFRFSYVPDDSALRAAEEDLAF